MQQRLDRDPALDVFHLSPNAYLVLTPDLIVADANRVFCTLTDRRREQIIGRSLVDVYPQEATPAARAAQASIRRSMRAASNGGSAT